MNNTDSRKSINNGKALETYSVKEKKKYVRLFLSGQPVSQTKFCARHGFARQSFSRWLQNYGESIREEITQHTPQAAPVSDKAPATDSSPSPCGVSNNNGMLTVTIPYSEYLALRQIKDRFDTIRAVCR